MRPLVATGEITTVVLFFVFYCVIIRILKFKCKIVFDSPRLNAVSVSPQLSQMSEDLSALRDADIQLNLSTLAKEEQQNALKRSREDGRKTETGPSEERGDRMLINISHASHFSRLSSQCSHTGQLLIT